jgi:hypothetical protein
MYLMKKFFAILGALVTGSIAVVVGIAPQAAEAYFTRN